VTLRAGRMYEFLDRFISIAVPRMRDFRGLPTKSFDGRGNYTWAQGADDFPEIDYDKVERIHGMDITFVTSAGRDDTALASCESWACRSDRSRRPRQLRRPHGEEGVDGAGEARPEVQGAGLLPLPALRSEAAARCGSSSCGRICFRELALRGEIPGVRKASW